MSMFDNPDQIRLLQNLLNPKKSRRNSNSDTEEEDDDGEDSVVVGNCKSPADIGPASASLQNSVSKTKKKTFKSPYAPAEDAEKVNALPKSAEEWEQQQQNEEELLEARKCPEYTMTYKQAVGTEDVFLQMGNRNSSTASCEDLLLNIHMPDETVPAEKMNLSIMENEIDLATPVYRLKLPLVHKINVDRCSAKYDPDTHKLCLTLRLQREMDFVNF